MLAFAAPLFFVATAAFAASSTYEIDAELEAEHCEYYVDSLGIGELTSGARQGRFIDLYFRVNEHELVDLRGETLLAVGAVVNARSFTAETERVGLTTKGALDVLEFVERIYASRVAPGSWQLRYHFEERREPQLWFKEAKGLAFFLDVQRANGRIERLWIRDQRGFFPLDGLFLGDPGSEAWVGIGRIRFPSAESPVYRLKAGCSGS